MKHLLFAMAILLLSFKSKAQTASMPEPNPVIVTSFEITPPADGRRSEFDSLLNIYIEKGVRSNTLIKNFRVLHHWWGSDNMKLIFIYEVDGWNNINKALDKTDELLAAAMPQKEDQKKFWARYNRYIGKHSDEIMADVGKPKM